jgi:hypothetical protein
VEIQWTVVEQREVESCAGMRAARGQRWGEGATVAQGGAADTVKCEAREMRAGD